MKTGRRDAWGKFGIMAMIVACLLRPAHAASTDPSALCEAAAVSAAQQTGVPLAVLQAIALAESGRAVSGRQRPWPWAVNFGGQGNWYGSNDEAQLAVAERQAAGATNFDIGCFQINHRWHGDAFADIAAMFDPVQNALYAAEFLRRLHDETGSWADAAAAYHSRTPDYADPYRARFETLKAGLDAAGTTLLASAPRVNRFPLLQTGAQGGLGSLVPEQSGGVSLIGAAP